MSEEKKQNEVKMVAYLLAAKNLIKFVNDEKVYPLGEKVIAVSNFAKFPLNKGDSVEVGIKDDVVTYLRKQKSDAPKSEAKGSEEAYEPTPEETKSEPTPAPQAAPTVAGEAKELTVFAVSADKRVIKFLENKDEGWFHPTPEMQAQDYNVLGFIAKQKVKVILSEKDIVSVVKVASESPQASQDKPSEAKPTQTAQSPAEPPTQPVKKAWQPYDTAEKQTSIEAQAAVNAACDVTGRVAASLPQAPTANIINNMIRAIAEENYKLIQDLKKN